MSMDELVPTDDPEPGAGPGEEWRGVVLVVDDDEAVRRLVVRALEREGYLVLATGWPEEAIEIARRSAPVHALILDVVLPHISGIALAATIRRMMPVVPILFMSGYPVEAVAGATDFISKPFTPTDLVAAVDAVVSRVALA